MRNTKGITFIIFSIIGNIKLDMILAFIVLIRS